MGMKNQILILAIAGIFLSGPLLAQPAYAQTTIEELEALVDLLILTMGDFNIILTLLFEAVFETLSAIVNQECPPGQVMNGIEQSGAAEWVECGVFGDPVTGDTCIGAAAVCNPPQ